MSDNALRIVCEAADAWAGEYGFVLPDAATEVMAAIYKLCPDVLDQRSRDHFAAEDAGGAT